MSKKALLDTERASLWYHPQGKVIHHQFHSFISGQAFKDVMSKGVDAMKQYGATKWLSDDRGNSAISKDDTAWAQDVWTPAALAAGWKYWAIVMPEKAIGQMQMKRFAKDYAEQGVTVQAFSSPEEALKWLESK